MHEVTLGGDSGRRLTLSGAFRPTNPDPYVGSSFTATIEADGLRATVSVFMFGFDWEALVAFFAGLAADWRGWDGERDWVSVERDMRILATSDHLGHCHLNISVRNGPVHDWEAAISLTAALGSEMEGFAADIAGWVQDLFSESSTSDS